MEHVDTAALQRAAEKHGADDAKEPRYPRVHVPPIAIDDLFGDIFLPIARDGAGVVEVQLRLQKALVALSRLDDPRFRESARTQSAIALDRARDALRLKIDVARVEDAAALVL